jgi:hypothetical protein
MTHPNFVTATLGFLDSNYTTGNTPIGAAPTLINRDTDRIYPGGDRVRGRDLTNELTVEVSSTQDPQYEPVGSDYDLEFTVPVDVRIEAATTLANGPVPATADAWREIYLEVRRAIYVERTYPTPDPLVYALRIPAPTPSFADSVEYRRSELPVEFDGFEELP